jgi:hypothetical protein
VLDLVVESKKVMKRKECLAGHWWLTPVIFPIQEADIRRIAVGRQPRQIVQETLPQKKQKKSQKKAGGVAQLVRAPAK